MALHYETTQRKKSTLESHGQIVVDIWECTFNIKKITHSEIDELLTIKIITNSVPLEPRNLFLDQVRTQQDYFTR